MFKPDPRRLDTLAAEIDTGTMTLVIGKYHVACGHVPTGRGTMGYMAYVVGKQRLVFLKETWRGESELITPELEIYRRLYELCVENIAEVVGGGDVLHCDHGPRLPQRTRTHNYLRAGGLDFIPQRHYRVVIETLGLPLTEFKHSMAMTYVIRDAVKGKLIPARGVAHLPITAHDR